MSQKLLAKFEGKLLEICKSLEGKIDDHNLLKEGTFRDLYGINDITLKNKKALGRALVQVRITVKKFSVKMK